MGVFTEELTREQEESILNLYVTSPFEPIFFVYDTIPPEQFSMLAASYSRTHEPFQKRLLSSIVSGDLTLPKIEVGLQDILRSDLGLLQATYEVLTQNYGASETESRKFFERLSKIYGNQRISIIPENVRSIDSDMFSGIYGGLIQNWRVPPQKTKAFIEKWVLAYGHNSVKELANARFVAEGIPDLSGKLITGHPLAHPQVKSSRYIDWDKVLAASEENLDIVNSRYAGEIIEGLRDMGTFYRDITDKLEIFARDHPLNQGYLAHRLQNLTGKQTDESVRKSYDNNARKSMLDYSRYLLTPSMTTSLGCSLDVRSLEDVITGLLSSPLLQDQQIGETIAGEAKKALPVLMGDKSHAGVNDYVVATREAMSIMLPEIYGFERERVFDRGSRTNFPTGVEGGTDLFLAASASWQYGNGSFMQYYDELAKNPSDVKKVLDVISKNRGGHDAVHPSSLMSAPLIETLMDYGGDRDNHRHRRGSFLRQVLTTEHGYETPQVIDDAGLLEDYDAALDKADALYHKIRDDNPNVAQLVVPFANRCRRLLSWSRGQQAYYVELRSKAPGHDSYRSIAWDIADHINEKSPVFGSKLRVDRTVYPQHLVKIGRGWYDEKRRGEDGNRDT